MDKHRAWAVLVGVALLFSFLLRAVPPETQREGADPAALTQQSTPPELTGFTDHISYFPGDEIRFYVSSPRQDTWYRLFIYREGGTRELVHVQASEQPATFNPVLSDAEFGFEWEASATVPGHVTASWRSGYYLAQLERADVLAPPPLTYRSEVIPFLIKPAVPSSKILVQLPTNTWLAYNDRFGRSYYTTPRTFHASFRRPMKRYVRWISGATAETVTDIEGYYLRWLEQNGYTVDVVANGDLEDTSILNPQNYRLFISVGHDEYWSKPMRDTLQAFIDGGGNALFWSSNVIYYQVRSEDDGAVVLSYKLYEYCRDHDPLFGVDDSRVTTWWARQPVNNPETRLAGLSYHYGGAGVGGYRIYRANDWAFRNTGLRNGDVIGDYPWLNEDILAQEVDATRYSWTGGLPYPVQTDLTGTPPNFTILGVAARPESAPAVMGYYTTSRGSTVFHVGTWDWWKGLALNDPAIVQISHNVVRQLSAGDVTPSPVERPLCVVQIARQGLNGYAGTEDTTLNADAPEQRHGDQETLILAHDRNGQRKLVLIRFDLSHLAAPTAPQVASAQLRLYPVAILDGHELKVSRLTPPASWQESMSWQEATEAWAPGPANLGLSQENEFVRAVRRGVSFEVADQVRQWLAAPETNFGIALRGHTAYSSNYARTVIHFASSEHPDPSLRPVLVMRVCHQGQLLLPPPGDGP